MIDRYIEQAVEEIPQLIGIFVTAMPDSLLFSSWVRQGTEWSAEDVAAYFDDLIRSNRQGLKALGSWSSEMQVTIESAESLVVLRELSADFVCGCVFERSAPLGDRAGERAAHMAEEMTLDLLGGDRRAIDDHERLAPAL